MKHIITIIDDDPNSPLLKSDDRTPVLIRRRTDVDWERVPDRAVIYANLGNKELERFKAASKPMPLTLIPTPEPPTTE